MDNERQPVILIIDDAAENLAVLAGLLRPWYRVLAATSGAEGLRVARGAPTPDLILLDVMMPGMDGYQTLARLRQDPASAQIPVIFLTALADASDEEHGLQLGAADYITKPIKPTVVLARVKTQLEAKQSRDWLRDQNAALEDEVARRMADNDHTQIAAIRALACLAEIRDTETGNHILRTQGYVERLARNLQSHPRFSAALNERYIDLLTRSAPLHDIGKVGIPDHILLKPGKLDPGEWAIMQTHAKIGSDAIARAEQDIGRPLEFLALAKEIAHWHHERWDGGGYPDGLAGEAIPLAARIMAIADVFDALISVRVYKPPMSFPQAREIIVAGRGSHFDPDITEVFLADYPSFCRIAQRHQDAGREATANHPPGTAPS